MAGTTSPANPRWGNMVFHADNDVMAGSVLISKFLLVEGYYHVAQAVEKYLKALCIIVFDPNDEKSNDEYVRLLASRTMGHDLIRLANYCSTQYGHYRSRGTLDTLGKLNCYDQATRYPWVRDEPEHGFSGADIQVFFNVLMQLRNDLPIIVDNYPLGTIVRGYRHNLDKTPLNDFNVIHRGLVFPLLKEVFPDIESMVRI